MLTMKAKFTKRDKGYTINDTLGRARPFLLLYGGFIPTLKGYTGRNVGQRERERAIQPLSI